MIVFASSVNVEFFYHRATDRVFGKHSLNGLIYDEFGFFGHKFFVLNLFEAADVSRMITIIFLFEFLAGETNLIGIDDNDIIARIHFLSTSAGFAI